MDKKVEFVNIDEYILRFPLGIQDKLNNLRSLIKEVIPQAEEKISYQMPTFAWHGNLVHFAAFKNHLGFYPGPEAINAHLEALQQYKISKGTIQFPLNQPLPNETIRSILLYVLRAREEKIADKQKRSKPSK